MGGEEIIGIGRTGWRQDAVGGDALLRHLPLSTVHIITRFRISVEGGVAAGLGEHRLGVVVDWRGNNQSAGRHQLGLWGVDMGRAIVRGESG